MDPKTIVIVAIVVISIIAVIVIFGLGAFEHEIRNVLPQNNAPVSAKPVTGVMVVAPKSTETKTPVVPVVELGFADAIDITEEDKKIFGLTTSAVEPKIEKLDSSMVFGNDKYAATPIGIPLTITGYKINLKDVYPLTTTYIVLSGNASPLQGNLANATDREMFRQSISEFRNVVAGKKVAIVLPAWSSPEYKKLFPNTPVQYAEFEKFLIRAGFKVNNYISTMRLSWTVTDATKKAAGTAWLKQNSAVGIRIYYN